MITSALLAMVAAIGYPTYIYLTYENDKAKILAETKNRVKDYQWTIFLFWVFTAMVLLNHFFFQNPPINLGLSTALNWKIITGFVVVIALLFWLIRQLEFDEKSAAEVLENLTDLLYYLPKTRREHYWFIALSFTAGFCEEIIYRGFLFGFIQLFIHPLLAVLAANFFFAIAHVYSGKSNMIRSFFLGLLFSGIYYLTESLWVSIFLHIAIDVYSGTMGYKIAPFEKNPA